MSWHRRTFSKIPSTGLTVSRALRVGVGMEGQVSLSLEEACFFLLTISQGTRIPLSTAPIFNMYILKTESDPRVKNTRKQSPDTDGDPPTSSAAQREGPQAQSHWKVGQIEIFSCNFCFQLPCLWDLNSIASLSLWRCGRPRSSQSQSIG